MRTVALLSFLMLTAMLAGCTEVPGEVDTSEEPPSMTFLEASSTLAEGTCGSGAEDCHIIRVQVNNSRATDIPTTSSHWTIRASNGGVYPAHSVIGPIAIASNASLDVTILFSLGPNLTADVLRWDDLGDEGSERVTMLIPSYDHVDSSNGIHHRYSFNVADADGEVNADGNNTLVYIEMTDGDPINWAYVQVNLIVDGNAQTVCEGPSNVDETGCKVVDNGDGDTEFEVTDGRIIVQEESQICESACSIVVTIFDTQNQQQMYQSGAISVN